MDISFIFSSGIMYGLIWSIMVIGIYITYRVLDIADLGVEGTFPLGACVAAILISVGCPAIIATIIAIVAGAFFGMITGILHTKLKIPAILSGIITMTGLYTINMLVLGGVKELKNNLTIPAEKYTIFDRTRELFINNRNNIVKIVLAILMVVCIIGIVVFGVRLLKIIIKKQFKANLKNSIFAIVMLSVISSICFILFIMFILAITNISNLNIIKDLIIKEITIATLTTTIISIIVLVLVFYACYWFFGTEIGMSLRATGNNKRMAKAQGINTDLMIILGLAISNGLVALCGAIFAQDQGFGNIEQGRGVIVIGLAAIILGESIFGKRDFKNSMISIIIGSIIYYILEAVAIDLEVSNYLKLVRAVLIVVVLVAPIIQKAFKKKNKKTGGLEYA